MTLRRIDHVGIIFNDLPAAKAFFLDLGLKVVGEGQMEGEALDKTVGLKGVKTEFVMLGTPDGQTNLELIKFHSPSAGNDLQALPANTLGIRHIAFPCDDIEAVVAKLKQKGMEFFSEIQTFGTWKLCYCRGPEGVILELAQQLK